MKLAQTKGRMAAHHVKIRLANIGDRAFATAFAKSLELLHAATAVEVKGNWLHIDNVPILEEPKP